MYVEAPLFKRREPVRSHHGVKISYIWTFITAQNVAVVDLPTAGVFLGGPSLR